MYKLFIWNINQRSNKGGQGYYPDIILETISKEYDIIILNEFYKHNNWETNFSICGHHIVTSNNGKNEILIAYNSDMFSAVGSTYTWQSNYDKDSPDYLDINLKDRRGNNFYVVGCRILVDKYEYRNQVSMGKEMEARHRQGEKISNRIKEICDKGYPIIGGGDMNTGRRTNSDKNWSYPIFSSLLPENVKTVMPDGISHMPFGTPSCPDQLFFSQEFEVCNEQYNWDFTQKNSDIYTEGKNTKGIPSPYPDHAIITAEFTIKDFYFSRKEYLTIGSYFPDGGEVYTYEELSYKLTNDLDITEQINN